MLPEILEPDATGAVAATYARIKQVQGTTVVNLIWRHLATMEGGLGWAWPAAEAALPAIRAATGGAVREADALVDRHGLARGFDLAIAPGEAVDVVRVYDRGNRFNMLAMAALAAMRAGAPVPAAQGPAEPPGAPARPVPPMPRFDTLAPAEQEAIDRLAAAGPAAASGVRPSLWVHLALWPTLLRDVEAACTPILSGPGFRDAHAALRDRAATLLGLPPPGPAGPDPVDRAIDRFRQRIPEMVLVGRVLLRAGSH